MAFVSLSSGCTCQYSSRSNTKLIIHFCKVHWGACIRNLYIKWRNSWKILIMVNNKYKSIGVHNMTDGWMFNCPSDLVCKYNSAGVQVFSETVVELHKERCRNLLSVEQIVWTGAVEAAGLTWLLNLTWVCLPYPCIGISTLSLCLQLFVHSFTSVKL